MTRAEAARHASLVRWKKESPLGKPDPAAIQARVKEILAANAAKKNKKPKGTGGKGKAPKKVDPAKAKAKADREKAQAAKKQERDQAKQERVAAQVAKQKQAEDRKQRILAEKVKRGDKLSAADTIDAQDAGLLKETAKPKPAKPAAGGSGKKQAEAKEPKQQASAPKPDKAKEQASNRAKVAQAMADQDAGLSPGGSAALTKFADGGTLDDQAAQQLGDMGLVETGADGAHRLSTEGRAAVAAMGRGDTRGALDAISRASDKKKASADKAKADAARTSERDQATAQRTKAQAAREKYKADREAALIQGARERNRTRKGLDMSDLDIAIKAGARHSRSDMQHLQAIHDSAVACGASCDPGDDEETDDSADLLDDDPAGKAIKGIMDDPRYYAMHECGDIAQASSALSTLTMLIQSELSEDDEDDTQVNALCDAADTLLEFIQGELKELRGAAGDAADTIGHEPMKAVIGKRDDVNPKAGVSQYGNVAFADEKNKKYPIDTEEHIRAAYTYINHPDAAAKYSADEVKTIKAKIVSAWKKTIDPAGPPSAGKALDDAWLHIDGGAIKALDDGDAIGGYAVLFGDASTHDIERDYYTKATNFWLDDFGWPRPITYHHGMDAATRDDPVIGHWTKANIDDTGVWLEGQLDRAHAYYKAIKQLAARGYLKLSSDSAPQWVQRERQQNGANFVKRWPLITASTTVTPMEPRMMAVEVKALLAEIGVDAIDTNNPEAINPASARDGAKADDDERARRLLLELDLLELEQQQ